jgi:hypothetical protein
VWFLAQRRPCYWAMAVTNEKKGAITGAAISVTTAAVAYGLKRALGDRDRGLPSRRELPSASGTAGGENVEPEGDGGEAALGGSPLLPALKQLVAHALLPMIGSAARRAGLWAGEKAPGADQSPLGVRFVEAFRDAAGPGSAKSAG